MGGLLIYPIGSSPMTYIIVTHYFSVALDWVITQTYLKYTITRVDSILSYL